MRCRPGHQINQFSKDDCERRIPDGAETWASALIAGRRGSAAKQKIPQPLRPSPARPPWVARPGPPLDVNEIAMIRIERELDWNRAGARVVRSDEYIEHVCGLTGGEEVDQSVWQFLPKERAPAVWR
jgi:hypothetical protein